MRRFLALLSHFKQETELASTTLRVGIEAGLAVICQKPGMLVMARAIGAHAIESDGLSATILGDLYYRHGPGDAFDGSASNIERLAPICRDRSLASRCWGSFLLLQQHSSGGSIEAYHSPLSSLPVYHANARGALLLASDARLLAEVQEERPGVDWQSLAAQLALDDFAFRSTCITGVKELRGGEALDWKQNARPEPYFTWDPWSYASRDHALDDEDAALEVLEREILRCTSARLNDLAAPLLDLSGGLDSSILAAVAGRRRIDVRAVNVFAQATEGDERGFARAVADHLDIALTESEPRAELVDVQRCASPHLPRPHARSFVQEIDRATLSAAPQATAFVNGGGGDAVLCHLQSSGPAVDRWKSQHTVAGFLRTVGDVCEAADVSYWVGLRKAMAKSMRRHRTVRLTEDRTFLIRDLNAQPTGAELPWPTPPGTALPGKLEHVRGIYSSCFNMHGFARSSQLKAVFPMLSQPLVETCLRIPTWMWLGQGHNRYLARKIAARWLPSSVAWRRSKGGLGRLQREIYHRNRGTLREMLLDGALQRAGVVERGAIAAQLSPSSDLTSKQFARLLRLADCESWAQHWL